MGLTILTESPLLNKEMEAQRGLVTKPRPHSRACRANALPVSLQSFPVATGNPISGEISGETFAFPNLNIHHYHRCINVFCSLKHKNSCLLDAISEVCGAPGSTSDEERCSEASCEGFALFRLVTKPQF